MDSFEFDDLNEAKDSFGPAVLEKEEAIPEAPLSVLEEKMVAFADAVAKLSDNPEREVIKRLHQERMRIMQILRPAGGRTQPAIRLEYEQYFDAMSSLFWNEFADIITSHLKSL